MKTLNRSLKEERANMRGIARTAQQSIPIRKIYDDGIWLVGSPPPRYAFFPFGGKKETGGKYSKTWRFDDINYAVASEDDKMELFMAYAATLNGLTAETKLTIINHRLNIKEFCKQVLIPSKPDELDEYRAEYNKMLLEKAKSGNGIVQGKYITAAGTRRDSEDARGFFLRAGLDIQKSFDKIHSKITEVDTEARLRILHDFFRVGEDDFSFDEADFMRKGYDYRDEICPDYIEFKSDHFIMGSDAGEKYGRALFMKNYASFIKDSMITKLADLPRELILSIDILPIPTDEAVHDMENRMLAVESDVTRWQRRQNSANNFSAVVPYSLEKMREETKDFLDDLVARDQRMMFVVVTLVHIADSLEDLNADTDTLESIWKKHLCTFSTLKYQQEEGLNTALPYGVRPIETLRTLTSESTAVLMPFSSQEVQEAGGVYYGVNAVSRNLIVCNRKNLLNGNGFILGVSGGGKSFAAKGEMVNIALATDDDIIIIDPEREYGPLVGMLGGEVIHISATSKNYINALDMSLEYGDQENPIVIKSEFIMTLCDQIIGKGKVGAKEKSIIDKCVTRVYRSYMTNHFEGTPPTLVDFHKALKELGTAEANDVADAIELFVNGNLNIFAHQTNVNMQNRIMLYDILDLGKQLKTVGMLVMLDAVMNRVAQNRKKKKATWVYIDEIYLFFANDFSAGFLMESWKRFRKYGALATGITQNVEDCLRSDTARTMLANSEYMLMLSQAATDREELARLLHISEDQMGHITNAGPGEGLIKIGGALVPFQNHFPRNKLYALMSTRPGEAEV